MSELADVKYQEAPLRRMLAVAMLFASASASSQNDRAGESSQAAMRPSVEPWWCPRMGKSTVQRRALALAAVRESVTITHRDYDLLECCFDRCVGTYLSGFHDFGSRDCV